MIFGGGAISTIVEASFPKVERFGVLVITDESSKYIWSWERKEKHARA